MSTIRTELLLQRFDKNLRLLEKRRQQSRSWTINLLGILYAHHAQLLSTAPLATLFNDDATTFNVDTGSSPGVANYVVANNRVGAAPGIAQELIEQGAGAYGGAGVTETMALCGCHLGIQVGTDNTAVTPTDKRLGHRIGHGRRSPDGAALVFEQYTTGDDSDQQVYGAQWAGMSFVPSVDHRCSSALLKVWRQSTSGNLTVEIRAIVTASGQYDTLGSAVLATGTILQANIPTSQGTAALVEVTWATPVDLYAGHRYALICHADTGDGSHYVNWRYKNTGATYERGLNLNSRSLVNSWMSYNSGSTWSNSGYGQLFQEKGQSQGEFEYGGCELSGIAFSDPNGSFTIRRFFYNNCGSNLTVQEVGITAAGVYHQNGGSGGMSSVRPFLIARDVVSPGVTVSNGQILLVSYVPAITV